jgi:hypothetical protein
MIVARQFIAWYGREKEPSRRVRYDLSPVTQCNRCVGGRIETPLSTRSTKNGTGINRSHRTLRDGSFMGDFPGNKLPGYLHSVPPGHGQQYQSRKSYRQPLPL